MIRGIAWTNAAGTGSATIALNSHVSVDGEPSAKPSPVRSVGATRGRLFGRVPRPAAKPLPRLAATRALSESHSEARPPSEHPTPAPRRSSGAQLRQARGGKPGDRTAALYPHRFAAQSGCRTTGSSHPLQPSAQKPCGLPTAAGRTARAAILPEWPAILIFGSRVSRRARDK
jgi:hypothetical protein